MHTIRYIQLYRHATRSSWFEDEVEASSDYNGNIAQLCCQSELVRTCVQVLGEAPNAVRFLSRPDLKPRLSADLR